MTSPGKDTQKETCHRFMGMAVTMSYHLQVEDISSPGNERPRNRSDHTADALLHVAVDSIYRFLYQINLQWQEKKSDAGRKCL